MFIQINKKYVNVYTIAFIEERYTDIKTPTVHLTNGTVMLASEFKSKEDLTTYINKELHNTFFANKLRNLIGE